jgi:hypothetical protein
MYTTAYRVRGMKPINPLDMVKIDPAPNRDAHQQKVDEHFFKS